MTFRNIIIFFFVFLLFGYPCSVPAAEENFDLPAISGVLQQVEEKTKTMSVPENEDTKIGQEKAESLMQHFQAPEFQAVLQAEQQRVADTMFSDVLAEFAPQEKQGQSPGKLSTNERVYLFVSSSVPLSTLKSYATMIDRARDPNVVMVLRGFVGGMKKIKPTMEFIVDVLKKDPACGDGAAQCDSYNASIQIDPQLFQRYRIEQVPTVVYASGLKSDGEEPEEQASHRDFVIAGDAGLDWLLEKINREAKSRTLDSLISSLRHGGEQQ